MNKISGRKAMAGIPATGASVSILAKMGVAADKAATFAQKKTPFAGR